jgi:hypothetical protein
VYRGLQVEDQQGDGYCEDAITEGLDAFGLHSRQARTGPTLRGRSPPSQHAVPSSHLNSSQQAGELVG